MISLSNSLGKLRWRLTLSYSAVTVGALLVVVLILGLFLFSRVLVPLDILNSVMTPEAWIEKSRETAPSVYRYVLSQDPPDTQLIAMMMKEGDLQITYFDVLRIGDLQLRLRTVAEGSVLLLDQEGVLLGISNESLVSKDAIGLPLDRDILPGLEETLKTALVGETDPDRLFVTIEPDERFYFAVPYLDEAEQNVIGVQIVYLDHIPTEDDLISNALSLVGQSTLFLLLAAGLVGSYFGYLTAKGMVNRLQHASDVADAWSQGNFSEFIDDPVSDEIGQLGQRLNRMAEQLINLLKRRQEMAVSEERNRLARDLHDSAKQQALAASFQIGTAITLFERDAQTAKSHLVEADRLVDSVRMELTDLIHELRPQAMNGKGIAVTFNDFAIEWAHQSGIEVNVDVTDPLGLSLEAKQGLYRILQEALANIERHSSAQCVEIILRAGEENQLVVQDDGHGFNVQEQYGGMGLQSMKERAETLGGSFTIESETGKGTRILVTFPASHGKGELDG